MLKRDFWLPILIGILITPVGFIVGGLLSGAGHDLTVMVFLFPFSTLLGLLTDYKYGSLNIALFVLQFPIYGLAIGGASLRDWFRPIFIGLLVAHLLAVVVYVALSYSSTG